MLCTHCNSEISEDNKFCPNCGSPIEKKEKTTEKSNNNGLILDNFDYEKFEAAYVGKNYEKLKNKTFSWATFFLGPAYFIYRKLYAYALLFILINVAFPGGFILGIIFGFLFIKTYFNDVHSKVGQIKLKNQDKSDEELLEICRQKGGVNLIGAIIFEIVCIALLVGSIFLIVSIIQNVSTGKGYGPIPSIEEIIEEYGYGDDIGEDNGEDNGENNNEQEYSYNKEGQIGVNTVLKFIVPNDYRRIVENEELYVYETGATSCHFAAVLIRENTTPEEYLKKQALEATLGKETIANTEFSTSILESTNKTIHNYVTSFDGILYELTFSDTNDSNNVCEEGRNKILNSIEINKGVQEETYSNIKGITYNDYENMILTKQTFILLMTKSTCSHCKAYKPVLNKVLSTYNLTAYELDLDLMSNEDYEKTRDLNVFGTPTTIFITEGEEKTVAYRIVGEADEDKIIKRLKDLNYIESDIPVGSEV